MTSSFLAAAALFAGTSLVFANGENLARSGTATAVSVWHNSPDMTPDKAIDGDMHTRWSAEGRNAWFQIEWTTPQKIRGAVLRNYDDSWNKNIPFTCQVWDGSLRGGKGDFRNVQTVTPPTSTVAFQFPEVTTTKLRVTNVITFWELEVYDDDEILDRLASAMRKTALTVAGDLRGHLTGSLSRGDGSVPVADAAVSVSGKNPLGPWREEATTGSDGLFQVDLPFGSSGPIKLAAKNTQATVDAGDIVQQLTPRPASRRDFLALDGQWEFEADPASRQWSQIKVPAHWEMEGFIAKTGRAVYRRKFSVPKRWRGRRIKFRAEGIYSKAEIFINGHRLGSHDGGATPVELDATDALQFGGENTIIIQVSDHSDSDDFSAMSFYAHFNLGGIWRPLELFCVEPAHISRLAVETDFDGDYRDAELRINLNVANEQLKTLRGARLMIDLTDPNGRKIAPAAMATNLDLPGWENCPLFLTTRIYSPQQWSAESPALYTLKARLIAPGQPAAEIEQSFGFKQVKVTGKDYTLNGQPVKFWGACRHDAAPLSGRAIDKKTAWQDVELMKGANLTAMRTSHYPPNPEALNAADHLGLYVEDEAPFCWNGWAWLGRTRNVTGDLRLAPLAIQLASELVERDRNHPSVSIWSVCNESTFGGNLDLVRRTIKEADPSRPESAGQSANLDLATYHNPTSMERIQGTKDLPMPVLFDEGFCIFQGFGPQADGLELDPGLRDYWVTVHFDPLKAMLRDNHYLGAMIWAWVDDAFLVPGRGYEYGRSSLPHAHIVDDVYGRPGRGIVGDPMWGIIDGWRRLRPEYWLTKKLFSPIHIAEKPLVQRNPIQIPVENRNYFLNLDQYECHWRLGDEHGEVRAHVPPHTNGLIEITTGHAPPRDSVLTLEFYDKQKRLVDGYNLTFAPARPPSWEPSSRPAAVAEQPASLDGSSNIRLLGDQVELAFDRASGNLSRGVARDRQVLFAGPNLHVLKNNAAFETYPAGWHFTKAAYTTNNNGAAVLEWDGNYGDFTGGFTVRMDDSGHAEIYYKFRHTGGDVTAREIGLVFEIPLDCDTLNWDRKAEWSYYPDSEIGRPRGTASAHGKPPGLGTFAEDDHPMGCNDFRSTKRNIYWASLTDNAGAGIKVVSNGRQHIRATVGTRSIAVHVLDYYGGAATGTPEWDGTYGVGKIIRNGDTVEGTVRLEMLGGKKS